MHLRLALPLMLLLMICCSVSFAQQPGPEFWRKLTCQPYEPRTKLEGLEMKTGTVVLRGFTQIVTTEVRGVRIDALELRVLGTPLRAKGVVVAIRENAEHADDNRAFVDYDDLDTLVAAIDSLSRVDETATKLAGFEAHYHTAGDLELRVFRQTRSGTAVTLQTGICNRTTQNLSLDDLAKIKALLQEAKSRLDELR
jgi:hypothetical protein